MNYPAAITNLAVIAITVCFSYAGFANSSFLHRYLFSTQSILGQKQYYRLISSGLLHADWTHLIFNMYSLYSFGSIVEIVSGRVTFLAIYLAGIVGGNILALVLHRKYEYYALGASGGVCGIIFACIFLFPGTSVRLFLIPIDIPAYIYVIIFMLGSYYGIRTQRDNIGHDAHLGGAIIGLLTTTALHPSIVPQNPVLYPVVLTLAAVLFVLIYKRSVVFQSSHLWFDIRCLFQRKQTDSSEDDARLERLLKKISDNGLNGLSKREKKLLETISARKRQVKKDGGLL
jgi:membrane associated rhomboid family serine protease